MTKLLRFFCLAVLAGFFAADRGTAQIIQPKFQRPNLLTWTSTVPDYLVSIERTTNLASPMWIPLKSTLPTNQQGQLNLPNTNKSEFFRTLGVDLSSNPAGMQYIPAGYFLMGDPYNEGSTNELPVHLVYVSPFFIDRFELTNQKMRDALQWAYDRGRVTSDTRLVKSAEGTNAVLMDLHRDDYATSSTRYWSGITFTDGLFSLVPGRENQPCIDVSWHGAAAFCTYRSLMEGLTPCFELTNYTCNFSNNGYRLPTEAEWEKAARGGMTAQHYPWESYGGTYSSFINTNIANYTPPILPHPFHMQSVGYYNGSQVPPGLDMMNGYGLYDMAGNSREWCYDWYADNWYSQPGATLPDPVGPSTGTNRCQRGGSFDLGPKDLRCSARDSQVPVQPTAASWYNGFRCARRVN